MAFGINRKELEEWKSEVKSGNIAILTHYWLDERFPKSHTVTKVGCSNIAKLQSWGKLYNLPAEWIDYKDSYPHYDLFGNIQINVLKNEGKEAHISRFKLKKED